MGVKAGVVWSEKSEVLKEKTEASEELLGDWLAEFADMLKWMEDVRDGGEYGVGERAWEVLGDVSGDFKLISEGDVFFLNSLIAGEGQGDMWGERKFDPGVGDALEDEP